MAALLRRVGIKVRSIYQAYPKKKHEAIKDPTWIELCGKKGWIAISGDKRLEKNVENRTAVIRHKAKIFILTDTNSLPEEWAAAVIVGREKIINVVSKNPNVAFFSTIQRQSRSHVSNARFPTIEQPEVRHEEKNSKKTENIAGLPADDTGGIGDATGAPETSKTG